MGTLLHKSELITCTCINNVIVLFFLFFPTLLAHISGEFDDVLDTRSAKSSSQSSQERISLVYSVKDSSESEANGPVAVCSQKLLEIEDLTLRTPTNEAILIKDLSLQVNVNDHLLVGVSYYIYICVCRKLNMNYYL